MLARYQVSDKEHLLRRIRLFQDAALSFAVFVSTRYSRICLIPAFGPMFAEMLKWPGATLVGLYNGDADQTDIVEDVRTDAYWIQNERRDKVQYHRYRHRVVAREYLRRRNR